MRPFPDYYQNTGSESGDESSSTVNSESESGGTENDEETESTAEANHPDTRSDATETASAHQTHTTESRRSTDNTGYGVGLFGLDVSRDRQKFMEIIDRLYRLGVQADLDIPQICLLGMQSAGKSSLIEAICGIKVPRAAGTCTRCPIEVRINCSRSPWQCQIGLRFMYNADGSQLDQSRSVQFGQTIMHPDNVEAYLKDAFQALLNPSIGFDEFVGGRRSQAITQSELSFSKNCITVHIQGPGLCDLAFVDLPGLIASARGGRVDDIALIESLIISYIKRNSCLVLLVVSCESDFETQSAYQMAKKYDPSGSRTVGVLTKPDRIERGNEEQWLNLLKNDDEHLELGWYCTKLPDSSQIGMSWKEAREAEEEWFSGTRPWSLLLHHNYQDQLGTQCLIEHLSGVLADLIKKRLPELKSELDEILNKTKDELQALPARPSEDYLSEMMHLIMRFAADVRKHTEGIPETQGLIQAINSLAADFKKSLLSTAPSLKPFKHSEAAKMGPLVPPIELLEGEEEDKVFAGKEMHVDEVMEILISSRTRELPDAYPDAVPRRIISECKKNWHKFAEIYCEEVYRVSSNHFRKLVDEHFKHYESGGLYNMVQSEIHLQLNKNKDDAQKRLEWLTDVESLPYTLNSAKFLALKSRFLGYYKLHHSNALNPHVMSYLTGSPVSPAGTVIDGLTRMGISNVKQLDLAKLLPEDRFEPALDVMATVSAYYQVACKRYLDFVPGIVDKDLIRDFAEGVQASLLVKIVSRNAPERCRQLLQESPLLASRREKLKQRFTRLEAAKNELMNASNTI